METLKKRYQFLRAQKIIKQHINYKRDNDDDRQILEAIIFPYILSAHNPQKILDIGREDYQHFYNKFFADRKLWTIDIDPQKKEFGADNHIIDNVANLEKYFSNNFFDFIIMNGVFGWGLNKENEVQKTFQTIYDILKLNGIFIFGWNDDIIPLNKIKGLNKLKPYYLKPLNGVFLKCSKGKHIYNFYIKQ